MVSNTPAVHRLRLDGELTVRDAEALHARLLDAVNGNAAVSVDCSAATVVDVCALQLLLAAHRTARQRGRRLVLTGPPDGALKDALVRSGCLTEDGAPSGRDAALWNAEGAAA